MTPDHANGFFSFLLAAGLTLAAAAPGQTNAGAAGWTNAEAVLTSPAFWEDGLDDFGPLFVEGQFRWTSASQEALRSAQPGVFFTGLPVVESVVWLKAKRPKEVVLSLYNRGDCPPMEEAEFRDLLKRAGKNLAALARTAVNADSPAAFKGDIPKRQVWKYRTLAFELTWDSSQKTGIGPAFQAEFIRLRLLPASQAGADGSERQANAFTAAAKKITTAPNGDVYLPDVPMVDQGPKGYCAVAATERVLRYYGAVFDQHQLAQIAGTDAGTDPAALAKALSRSAIKLRIDIDVLEDFSVPEFLKLIKTYNTNARKAGKAEITLPDSGTIEIGAIYALMDPGVLLDTRTRNPTGVNKFADRIKQHVQGHVPLVWGVMLGVAPEENLPQAKGGHIRLIIGYNEKKKELLYTDSWGAGHELKRMPLPQAFAITTTLFSIRPK